MPSKFWTDDLPKCQYTGIAYYPSTIEINSDESEDGFKCFYCQFGDNSSLYGVFDAHNGDKTAQFVLQKMAAEILLGQLTDESSDEEIKEVLRNAFLSVEKAYIESIDELVAERISLQFELQLTYNNPEILEKLKEIDEQLSIGATSVIALIHSGKLYVANVGNSRALLCKTDDNCVLRVVQLSVDHSLGNEDELLRLSQLGLDINKLREADTLGNQSSTRCLGNYLVKGLYLAFPDMRTASSEPVIAIPELHGPINLDQSCRFLVLMSDGLYRNLQESTETEQVNKRFAQMVVEQFRTQPSLTAVCQAVVNQIMTIYQDYCSQTSQHPRENNRNTLLIRNFNFQLPNAPVQRSPLAPKKNFQNKQYGGFPLMKQNNAIGNPENSVIFNEIPKVPITSCERFNNNHLSPNTKTKESPNSTRSQSNTTVRFNPVVQSLSINDASDTETVSLGARKNAEMQMSSLSTHEENDSTCDSGDQMMSTISSQFVQGSTYSDSTSTPDSDLSNKSPVDKNKKVAAYVDFSQYYENVEKDRLNGTLPSFLSPTDF